MAWDLETLPHSHVGRLCRLFCARGHVVGSKIHRNVTKCAHWCQVGCGEEARVENDFFANGDKIVDILVVPLPSLICLMIGNIALVGVPQSFHALLIGGDIVPGGLSQLMSIWLKRSWKV